MEMIFGIPVAESRTMPAHLEVNGYNLDAQVTVRNDSEVTVIESGKINEGDIERGTFAYYPEHSQVIYNVYGMEAQDRGRVYDAVEGFVATVLAAFSGTAAE